MLDILEVYKQTRVAQERLGVAAVAPVLQKYVGATHFKSGEPLPCLQNGIQHEDLASQHTADLPSGEILPTIIWCIVGIFCLVSSIPALMLVYVLDLSGYWIMMHSPRERDTTVSPLLHFFTVSSLVMSLVAFVASLICYSWLTGCEWDPYLPLGCVTRNRPASDGCLLGGPQKEAQVNIAYLLYCEDNLVHLRGSSWEVLHQVDVGDITFSVHGDGRIARTPIHKEQDPSSLGKPRQTFRHWDIFRTQKS